MNIDQILKQLHEAQNEPSPEELFRQKLAASDPKLAEEEDNVIEEETKEVEDNTAPETEETTEEVVEDNLEEEKEVVAQLDAQGRIMARAFIDEIEKLSSAQNLEVNKEDVKTDEAEEIKLAESRVRILEKIWHNLNPEDN